MLNSLLKLLKKFKVMEFKGTKGKWEIDKYNSLSSNCKTIIIGACIGSTMHEDEEAKANAQLISCAPEMLEILGIYLADLHNIMPQSDAQRSRIFDVEQLIKKATEI